MTKTTKAKSTRSPYGLFKTDSNVEKVGVELDYGEFIIRIARAGGSNVAYLRETEKRFMKYRKLIQAGAFDLTMAEAIQREIYADTIILGWTNVVDQDGVEMAFTRENVIKLLTDLPDLFADIREQSTNLTLFRENLETDLKN